MTNNEWPSGHSSFLTGQALHVSFFVLILNSLTGRTVKPPLLRLASSTGVPKVVFVKNAGLILVVLLFASLGRLSAQVTVELLTDQDEFLPGESIPVIARITNRSGQTLTFGQEKGWLKFSVSAHEGYVGMRSQNIPTGDEFTLQSSERANVKLNLAPYFELNKAGHYQITATVAIPEWNRQINSDAKSIDVISGARVWQQEFGVPKAADNTNGPPELRVYALQEANYLRRSLMLYAQVTDSGGRYNHVTPIGPMISFGQPTAKVDKASNLHVLYQNGPRKFSYTVINPDCEIITRQTYDYTSRPRMIAVADGNITVEGGTRRIASDDLPAPKAPVVNDVSLPPNP